MNEMNAIQIYGEKFIMEALGHPQLIHIVPSARAPILRKSAEARIMSL